MLPPLHLQAACGPAIFLLSWLSSPRLASHIAWGCRAGPGRPTPPALPRLGHRGSQGKGSNPCPRSTHSPDYTTIKKWQSMESCLQCWGRRRAARVQTQETHLTEGHGGAARRSRRAGVACLAGRMQTKLCRGSSSTQFLVKFANKFALSV